VFTSLSLKDQSDDLLLVCGSSTCYNTIMNCAS